THEVLRGIDFRVTAGTTVALVGPTGAGKSTIVSLLTRLYDPTRGAILIDGVPLNQLALAQIRNAMAVVPQDAFVFSETIAENIALGIGSTEDRRMGGGAETTEPPLEIVEQSARIAHLHETVTE